MFEVAYSIGSLCPFCTVCAAAVLTTMVGTNRMVAANGSGGVHGSPLGWPPAAGTC